MNDSVDLLKAEIAKEEALLARETKSLQEMDKNAKRAEAERKRQTKNVCSRLSRFKMDWLMFYDRRNTPCSDSWMHFLELRILGPLSSCFSARKIVK